MPSRSHCRDIAPRTRDSACPGRILIACPAQSLERYRLTKSHADATMFVAFARSSRTAPGYVRTTAPTYDLGDGTKIRASKCVSQDCRNQLLASASFMLRHMRTAALLMSLGHGCAIGGER